MNADFIAGLEFWEREKGVSREVLMGAVQGALLSAAKKAVGPARELRVDINQKNGDIKAFAKLIVSEKVISQHDQISVFDARRIKADAQVGEELEKEVTPTGFGRVASQFAKQALMQKIRQAEKALIFTEFKDRVGDIISGTVRRFERSDVILDLGKYEALLPNRERVPTEEYQVGERIRCYVKAVEEGREARIQAIDMGRRGLHNEGAELMRQRLSGKIDIDFDTARRLFTLVCVLHQRVSAR